jgi:hypothetical protein
MGAIPLPARSLEIHFPKLPPSDNHIRVHRRQGGEVYSKEAEEYRSNFRSHAHKQYFLPIQKFVQGHLPTSAYRLTLVFYFETLVNEGWLKVGRDGKRGAKTVYKKMDAGNRRKLIEDCLADALGLDDSLTMELTLVKAMDPVNPRVILYLEEVNPADFGIPAAFLVRP